MNKKSDEVLVKPFNNGNGGSSIDVVNQVSQTSIKAAVIDTKVMSTMSQEENTVTDEKVETNSQNLSAVTLKINQQKTSDRWNIVYLDKRLELNELELG